MYLKKMNIQKHMVLCDTNVHHLVSLPGILKIRIPTTFNMVWANPIDATIYYAELHHCWGVNVVLCSIKMATYTNIRIYVIQFIVLHAWINIVTANQWFGCISGWFCVWEYEMKSWHFTFKGCYCFIKQTKHLKLTKVVAFVIPIWII